jgi:7-cyano-7-deazaguanine reductase
MSELDNSPLGKANVYSDQYDPALLFAISREGNRLNIGIDINTLPFTGVDIWNGFDFSWLAADQNPQYAMLTIYVPCDSPNLIESKSLKLYLFSFANTVFISEQEIVSAIERDLSAAAGKKVTVKLSTKSTEFSSIAANFTGQQLDHLDVSCTDFDVNVKLLKHEPNNVVTEQLCSDLLKSNCLVTGNPDWGSVRVSYNGPKIDQESLLKYIVSYRNHQGFHEQCIEQIFNDILCSCKPKSLSVEGRYTRRGGLDINPIRTNTKIDIQNHRLYRQ